MTTVSTDAFWFCAVGGRDPGAVSAAYFETRRHMSTIAESGYKQSGPIFYMARAGRPYRAWDTGELQATVDMIPACRIARQAGNPVRVIAWKQTSSTPLLDSAAFAIVDAFSGAANTAARLGDAAATAAEAGAGAAVDGAKVAAGAAGIMGAILAAGPVILAVTGLLVLYFFRRPILRFATGVAK